MWRPVWGFSLDSSPEMPHAERYFSREFDSSIEPCLKKSKLDYSTLCKNKNTEVYIPLETQSEKGNSKDYKSPEQLQQQQSQKCNTEVYIPLEPRSQKFAHEEYIPQEPRSQKWSSSGFMETRYYGSSKGDHENPRISKDFLNSFDDQGKQGSSRNYSSEAQYSKRDSNMGYSALCKNSEVYIPLETQSQKLSSSGFLDTRYYASSKGEAEKPKIGKDCLNSFDDDGKPGSSRNYSFESHYTRKEDINKKQQILEHPKADKCKNNNSEATFSETSAAFIGPLYQSTSKVESVSQTSHTKNSKLQFFGITTLVRGKANSKTNGGDGIDYELRQFYKEINELEGSTDDHNVSETTDHSQQHFSSYQSNAPTVHQVSGHHSQKFSSQLCDPLPNKPSVQIPSCYHPKEPLTSPAQHSALLSNNNQDFCDRPVPFDRTNTLFLSQSLPPPVFQGPPPPPFVLNFGPPPPRYNFPLMAPRENTVRNLPFHENEKYHSVSDNHPRTTGLSPWLNSHVPPKNMFSPQSKGYMEPFSRPIFESSRQTYQKEEFGELKGRHFNEMRLPQGGNVPHEQYPPRFREEAKCTDFKRKLVLLRGVPGSGKSTLARVLLDQSPDGIVFSTDDYFCQESGYTYDVKQLGDAHNWNQNRARRAMDDGRSPIIIDNTNIQGWEMKPYVQMAVDRSYGVEFLEPNTWWKLDAHELEKRNTHRVPRDKISKMLERFEHNMSVGLVLNSVEPRRVHSVCPSPETRQRWGASGDHSTPHRVIPEQRARLP